DLTDVQGTVAGRGKKLRDPFFDDPWSPAHGDNTYVRSIVYPTRELNQHHPVAPDIAAAPPWFCRRRAGFARSPARTARPPVAAAAPFADRPAARPRRPARQTSCRRARASGCAHRARSSSAGVATGRHVGYVGFVGLIHSKYAREKTKGVQKRRSAEI